MSLREIQQAVRQLPPTKRRRLTTWMVREFPALTVDGLMRRASRKVKAGTSMPGEPGAENIPTGAILEHAKQTAKRLGIAR